MYGTQPLPEDDIQNALAGLRTSRDALVKLRRQTPIDSLVGAQAAHVVSFIDQMAETLTEDRNYFRHER